MDSDDAQEPLSGKRRAGRKALGRKPFNSPLRLETIDHVEWFMDHDGYDTRGAVVEAATLLAYNLRWHQAGKTKFGKNPNPAVPLANPTPISLFDHWDHQGLEKEKYKMTLTPRTVQNLAWLSEDTSIHNQNDMIDVVVGFAWHTRQEQLAGTEFCISRLGDFSDGTRMSPFGHF